MRERKREKRRKEGRKKKIEIEGGEE